jgi:hypothetical protein
MTQLREIVRSRVDEMRAVAYAQKHSRAELLDALAQSAPPAPSAESDAPGTLHMCPWHTCQATRHG